MSIGTRALDLARFAGLLVPAGQFACLVDYYAENPDSHPWPEQLGLEMTLLDAAGWRAAIEEAGLEVVAQERLRLPGRATWQATEGSLLTLCRRPLE